MDIVCSKKEVGGRFWTEGRVENTRRQRTRDTLGNLTRRNGAESTTDLHRGVIADVWSIVRMSPE